MTTSHRTDLPSTHTRPGSERAARAASVGARLRSVLLSSWTRVTVMSLLAGSFMLWFTGLHLVLAPLTVLPAVLTFGGCFVVIEHGWSHARPISSWVRDSADGFVFAHPLLVEVPTVAIMHGTAAWVVL
ncbi:hypothetical protein [Nocardioides bruguierae]|uniref:Uncharacterized protein n=1 Tax=Nocardioides bruguierae TaxID=2945102 RepID=A0A9X2D6C1_9ACTN|nr:hypothetical protein [Nocardioides bruguierae]MCM0620188.1 hypothetical protein [Nocardioides bruguierae]